MLQDGQRNWDTKNQPSTDFKQTSINKQTFSPSKKVFSLQPPCAKRLGLDYFRGGLGGTEERMFILARFLGFKFSQGSTFLTQSMTKGMWAIWTKPLATMALHTRPKEPFHSSAWTLISICSGRVKYNFNCFQLCLLAWATAGAPKGAMAKQNFENKNEWFGMNGTQSNRT